MKDYFTHVLKNYTSSGDMDENIDHWLDSFENSQKKYIIMPSLLLNFCFLKIVCLSLFNHPQVSLIKKTKQDVI